jgi:hypothetical protein
MGQADPTSIDDRWRLSMTNTRAANSNAKAEPRDPKDVVESKISSASEKDALRDGALDDVSGGTWRPFSTTGKAG